MPSPLVRISDERLRDAAVELWLKRDDVIHPELVGNKWRKLKHNLTEAARQGHGTLLTFGGAYSNHLRAVAAAGSLFGFATIGIVRGEQHLPLNPVLRFATERGMRIQYLDRTAFRSKDDPELVAGLHRDWGDFYLLPEGGSNALAVRGCAEIPGEIGPDFDLICCPVGTGGTLAGIAGGLHPGQGAIGFSVLKGAEYLNDEVKRLQQAEFGGSRGTWHIEFGFHFGGYAKTKPELDDFVSWFAEQHGMQLDRVYVAKMMFGIYALAERGSFAPGTRIVAVVTG